MNLFHAYSLLTHNAHHHHQQPAQVHCTMTASPPTDLKPLLFCTTRVHSLPLKFCISSLHHVIGLALL